MTGRVKLNNYQKLTRECYRFNGFRRSFEPFAGILFISFPKMIAIITHTITNHHFLGDFRCLLH